jgi:hypothetical protein
LQEFRNQEFRSQELQEFRMANFSARSWGYRSKIIATICKLEIRGSILQLLTPATPELLIPILSE